MARFSKLRGFFALILILALLFLAAAFHGSSRPSGTALVGDDRPGPDTVADALRDLGSDDFRTRTSASSAGAMAMPALEACLAEHEVVYEGNRTDFITSVVEVDGRRKGIDPGFSPDQLSDDDLARLFEELTQLQELQQLAMWTDVRTDSFSLAMSRQSVATLAAARMSALQAHDPDSTVLYRKIRVKVLPD